MSAGAPLPRRAVLGAHVPPYAALVIVREVGAQLEVSVAGLAASGTEAGLQASRELRVALGQMREAARQLDLRRREIPAPAAAVTTSVGGSAEVVDQGSSAGSEMSSSEVAARLGVSSRWVRHMCGTGRLAATRRGRAWWVTQQALGDYLDAMEATA